MESEKLRKQIIKDEYADRVEESERWIEQRRTENDFDEVIAGIERVKAYEAEYYAQGIFSEKEYQKLLRQRDQELLDVRREQYQFGLEDSRKWIDDMDYYNEWEKEGDSKAAAIQRVLDKIEAAHEAGLYQSQKEYEADKSEWSKKLTDLESERITQEIDAEAERLKNLYQEQLDRQKNALERNKEAVKKSLDEERELYRKNADAKIAAIDEELEARRRLREDTDDNLRLSRLEYRLEHEVDEDNRRDLEKQIAELKSGIEDKEFEREAQERKDSINTQLEAELARIDEAEEYEMTSFDRRISRMESKFKQKLSDINIAQEVYNNLNISEYEELGKVLGEAVGKGLADSMEEYAYQGVRGIVSSAQKWVSEMYGNPIRAQGMDYSKVSKTNHIEVTQNFNVPVRSHYKTKLEAIQGFAELTRGL